MGNNQNSSGQTFRFILLFLAAFFLMRGFFAPGQKPNNTPPRVAPTLAAAFKGIAPDQKPLLDKTTAQAEITDLSTKIGGLEVKEQPGFWARLLNPTAADPTSSDEYSYWARLRVGLVRQYVLKDARSAVQMYDQVIAGATSGTPIAKQLQAQSIFQKGNALWHTAKGGYSTRQEAATTLEQLVHKGRGSSAFLDLKILAPTIAPSSTTDPALSVLDATGFTPTVVRDMRGSATTQNLEGLPDRVDLYYSQTTFHKIFDQTVRLFGNNPGYSYGLAILLFAVVLRLLLQPVNKRQYASAKGMQEIAPQMKKIQDKYKDKPEQQMQAMKEIRELQKAHGVNPMSALGWGLAQMPIFFFVVLPLIQHYEAKMELTGASFLWIHSLARADYPLLAAYALSQFLSFRLSATPPTDAQQAKIQGIMSVAMPLTIPLFLKDYPSAFTLYWMSFNILSTFFQYRMVKAHDPSHHFMTALMRSPFVATLEESLPSRPADNAREERKALPEAFSSNARNGKSARKQDVLSKISPFEMTTANGDASAKSSIENASASASSGKISSTNSAASRAAQRKRRRRR